MPGTSGAGARSVGIVNLEDATGNPYLDCMVDALAERGVAVVPVRLTPGQVWRARRGGVSAFHVHWPEYLIHRSEGRFAGPRQIAAFLRFVLSVAMCRLLSVRLVWTVHNLRPHDPAAPWATRWPYAVIGRAADRFVTHSADAGRRAAESYPRVTGRLVVAPHGNYSGIYGEAPAGAGAALRAKLGVPVDAVLLLAFGQVRAYKRLAELGELVASIPDDRLHVLITGSGVDRDHAALVERAASTSPRVHVDLRRIPDEEVAGLYAASDLAVLHYSEVFSSGALLLAMSEGIAAVTPRSGAAGEVAEWPALGMYTGDALAGTAAELMAVPELERRAAALAAAGAASWSAAAGNLVVAYFGDAPAVSG